MKDAKQKTKDLKRLMVPIGKLHPNPLNPNEMSDAQFNLLYDNIEKVGLTDPILCVPHPEHEGDYLIIGGEHRWEVGKLHGLDEVPITLNDSEDFDEDQQKFQIVRHNIIHGKMSPKKFLELYQSLKEKYTDEIAAESFGFAEQEEFERMIRTTRASLPDDMKKVFDASKHEIQTIEDLSRVLNHLFSTYGDTLEYNYMILDFGGKESILLRMLSHQKKPVMEFFDKCRSANRTADEALLHLIESVSGDEEAFRKIVDATPERKIPEDAPIGTLDFLDEL